MFCVMCVHLASACSVKAPFARVDRFEAPKKDQRRRYGAE